MNLSGNSIQKEGAKLSSKKLFSSFYSIFAKKIMMVSTKSIIFFRKK